ncbi:HGGxSTG domain-containing protein [Chromobacterium violaceum]|uniref:HGGxSTG domain-containing protein n=1 Tax=Chromobacterium violaceum TaxID=536 RepID=UPI003DA8EB26
MNDDERRRLLKAHYAEVERIRTERERLAVEHDLASWAHLETHMRFLPPPDLPPYPAYPGACLGLACGAKTRAGTPCKLTSIYENGRCKLHGGLSTGPRTKEGKRRAAQNGATPKRKQTP